MIDEHDGLLSAILVWLQKMDISDSWVAFVTEKYFIKVSIERIFENKEWKSECIGLVFVWHMMWHQIHLLNMSCNFQKWFIIHYNFISLYVSPTGIFLQ